jgi:exodeoxyribonuclease VII small subunit
MAKQTIDYQELSNELDHIIASLQANDIPIDEAIKLHGRGEQIITELEKYLKQAQNTIQQVTDKTA